MNWAVDVCILVWADEENKNREASQNFLNQVFNGDTIAVNESVLKSYEANSLCRKGFGSDWYAKMMRDGKIKPYMKPTSKKARELERVLKSNLPKSVRRFDPDDIPLVSLCFDSKDRHLISGDVGEGDFSPALTSWLHGQYQICFHDLAGKKPYHVSRHKCTKPRQVTNGT